MSEAEKLLEALQDPKTEAPPTAAAELPPAPPDPPSEVCLAEDQYGRPFDPSIHKHRKRGPHRTPMYGKPDARGVRRLMIRPGPGTKPGDPSLIVDPGPNAQSIPGIAPEIPPGQTISPADDPRVMRAGRMIERAGRLIAGESGGFQPGEQRAILEDLADIERETPGAIPAPSPRVALVLDTGEFLARVGTTEEAQQRAARVAEVVTAAANLVLRWWYGPPQAPPAPPEKPELEA